jgi:hypothetical protein
MTRSTTTSPDAFTQPRKACRSRYPQECAQFFERPDWFYLGVGQSDFARVIIEHKGHRWTLDPLDDFYLMWTDSLIGELHNAERALGVPASTSGAMPSQRNHHRIAPAYFDAPGSQESDGKEHLPSAHPRRARLLGSRLNGGLNRRRRAMATCGDFSASSWWLC